MTWEQDQKIKRYRYAKARRFVERFFHQMRAKGVAKPETDRAALEQALATVRDASREDWAQLAKDMHEQGAPSVETVTVIISELEGYVRRLVEAPARAAAQAAEDRGLWSELMRQRLLGTED